MTEPTKSEIAPGRLEAVRQFVNTFDLEDGTEQIGSPGELSDWLAAHGFGEVDAGAADVATFIDAREGLRALMLANNGEPLDDRVLARLDELAGSVDLRMRFSPQSRLEPAGSGANRALGEILATVHAAMAEGTWPRLKACRDHDCAWAFYDHSRNRSGTWCSMEVCGNRAKARTYRARHK